VNIPLGTGTLNDDTADRVLAELRRAEQRWLFVHCSSGGRAGGALLPYLLLDVGRSEEEAVIDAMRIGLRSAEYLDWGLDYARWRGYGGERDAGAAVEPSSGADPAVVVTWAGAGRFYGGRPGSPMLQMDVDGLSGPNPFRAFLSSVAGCAATDVVLILGKQRTPVQSLEVRVHAERVDQPPRRLKSLRLAFHLSGEGITHTQAERAVELSVTKYCSVRSSLAPDAPASWEVVLSGEEGGMRDEPTLG
jgi:putative redox protein